MSSLLFWGYYFWKLFRIFTEIQCQWCHNSSGQKINPKRSAPKSPWPICPRLTTWPQITKKRGAGPLFRRHYCQWKSCMWKKTHRRSLPQCSELLHWELDHDEKNWIPFQRDGETYVVGTPVTRGTLEQQKELEMMFSFRYMGKFTWNRDMSNGRKWSIHFWIPCWFLRMARWVKQNQLPNDSCCCPVCLSSRQTWRNIAIW